MDTPLLQPSEENPSTLGDMPTIGQLLKSDKYQYEITRYLGEGLTATVYESTIAPLPYPEHSGHVALKFLRPRMDELSISNYWNESAIIQELRSNNISCVPEIYDVNKNAEHPFIAMQLADDRNYLRLDWVLERQATLAEDEVLEIAIQGLSLLDVLHNKSKRTYTDMQLKNFCWNQQEKRLLVLDWNHVSFKFETIRHGVEHGVLEVLQQLRGRGATDADDLIRLDLLRFSSYLYTLLTGKTTPEVGATVWILEEQGAVEWAKVSQATRQVILNMLVPDPIIGPYKTVGELLAAMKDAQKLFVRTDVEELRNEISSILDSFDKLKNNKEKLDAKKLDTLDMRAQLQKAICYVDRLKQISKGQPENAFLKRAVERYEARLDELHLTISDKWAIGQRYFDIGNFLTAHDEYWAGEAERIGRVGLHRWTLIAQGAAQLGKTTYAEIAPDMDMMLEMLEQENLPAAQTALEAWSKKLAVLPTPLVWLKMEVDTLSRLKQAGLTMGQKQFQQASTDLKDLYQQIHKNWTKANLPYIDLLIVNSNDPLWRSAFAFASELVRETGPDLLSVLNATIQKLDDFIANEQQAGREAAELLKLVSTNMSAALLEKIALLLRFNPADPVVHDVASQYRQNQPQAKTPEAAFTASAFWSLLNRLSSRDYTTDIQKILINYYDLSFSESIKQRKWLNAQVYSDRLLLWDGTKQSNVVGLYLDQFSTALKNSEWMLAHKCSEWVLQLDGKQQQIIVDEYLSFFEQAVREHHWDIAHTLQDRILFINGTHRMKMADLYLEQMLDAFTKTNWAVTGSLLDDVVTVIANKSDLKESSWFQKARNELKKEFDDHINASAAIKIEIDKDRKWLGRLASFDLHYSNVTNIHVLLTKMESDIYG